MCAQYRRSPVKVTDTYPQQMRRFGRAHLLLLADRLHWCASRASMPPFSTLRARKGRNGSWSRLVAHVRNVKNSDSRIQGTKDGPRPGHADLNTVVAVHALFGKRRRAGGAVTLDFCIERKAKYNPQADFLESALRPNRP